MRHVTLINFLLCSLAIVSCRAVPDDPSPDVQSQEGASPYVSIATAESEIRIGDTFSVRIRVENVPANEEIVLGLKGDCISVVTPTIKVWSGSAGSVDTLVDAIPTCAKLATLVVSATTSLETLTDALFINFGDAMLPTKSRLMTASEATVGEPTSLETYFMGLPRATTAEEVYNYRDSGTPAFFVDNVRFPQSNGSSGEPVNGLEFGSNPEIISSTTNSSKLTAQAGCTTKSTYVYLKSTIDGRLLPLPAGTRVEIAAIVSPGGPNVKSIKYVGSGGRVAFNLACDDSIYITAEGYTPNGLTVHAFASGVYRWNKNIYGTNLNADSVRGKVLNLGDASVSSVSRLAQRVWFRTNQVYDWERNTPGSPYTNNKFALDIIYPARDWSNNVRSRAAYGQMQIVAGDALDDPTIFHEFGHEVYYRRILGGPLFEHYSRQAASGSATYPVCIGSLNWYPWKYVDGCTGMLEGFALWFDAVATRRLGTSSTQTRIFEPEKRLSSTPSTAATPGNVAQYLWDATDVHLADAQLIGEQKEFRNADADAIVSFTRSTDARYAAVARYFDGGATNEDLGYMFRFRIWPKLTATVRENHCKTLDMNKIGRLYPCN